MDRDRRSAIEAANSWPELRDRLAGLTPSQLGPREVHRVHRALRRCPAPPDLRLAYLANHTVDPLPRYAEVAAALEGLRLAGYTGPYGQHYQEVLQPESGLHVFAPDLIWLSLDLRGLAPRVCSAYPSLPTVERHREREKVLADVLDWVELARERTRATRLVSNFPRPPRAQIGIADTSCEYAEAEFYAELNLALLRGLRGDPSSLVFDLEQAIARFGSARASDPKLYYVARMRFAEAALPALADELLRHVLALGGRTRKCLVLDLDDTLWGGIVGEDGPLGVRVGPGDPVSEAFLAFQEAVLSLRERGVVLALCSKNNEADALEVFERRPEMPLRLEHFAARRINWENKAKNLASLAEELGIGVDSLVFVDDSPAECALVRDLLPDVRTLQLPRDPARYAAFLRESTAFERSSLTAEDAVKTQRYAENAERAAVRREVPDLGAFLERLETRVAIGPAAPHEVPRAHQLLAKTNQFNVTTVRHGLADLEHFASDPRFLLLLMEVADAFGELGIVGLCLCELEPDGGARIDSFVLSCRALGRGVETALMNRVKQELLLSGRCPGLRAAFRPTAKNAPAAGFFASQGFAETGRDDADGVRYELAAADAAPVECPGITVGERGAA